MARRRCRTAQVGSIPTGVFKKPTLGKFDIAGPAAQFALAYVGWRSVFRTWNLIKAISAWLAQTVRAPDC